MSVPSPGDPHPYSEWEETLATIVATGGTTLLLGGIDVGKTTFTRLLVNRAVEAGHRVAVLDADIGQSEIGPPACVGLAFVESPILALSDLTPSALAFVGSVSPAGHLPEHITAVRRLADLAADHFSSPIGAQIPDPSFPPFLVIDTSGYLHGSGARRLNQLEFDLVSPAHVVGLQRRNELDAILAPMRRRTDCRIHTPPIAAIIGGKPPGLRAQRRAMRFSAYFQNSQTCSYSFDDVALVGTWMGGGTPLPAHLLKFTQATLAARTHVYYAEMQGAHLGLMVQKPVGIQTPEMGVVLEQLRAREVSITVAPRLKHLLIGLDGANGKLLGLGLLVSLDFRRRELGVLTPVRAPAAARILRFGLQRVRPDGADAGALKPGEL